ncbi:MAG: helix-hairpin-helix domain-containing protein [Bacteroidales bacterium]|nr:helix-hairpin-helix domain-containing protein [Bacteroidales bacterium]
MNFNFGLWMALMATLFFTAMKTSAQLPDVILRMVEDAATDGSGENDASFLIDHYQALLEQPLNLNTPDPTNLEESLLFSSFQINQIVRYRERYGDFFSVHELSSIPGFTRDRLEQLLPFLSISASTPSDNRPAKGFHLISDIKTGWPLSQGYLADSVAGEPAYAGSPIRMNLRIKTGLGRHLSMGLAYQKDPGETVFLDARPQFVSGYIELSGRKCMKKLVGGSFRLHSGLGLVTGTGFNPSLSSFSMHQMKPAHIKPFASVSEQNFLNGLALQLQISRTDLISWISHNRQDLSLFNHQSAERISDWEPFFRNEGLHRTGTEIGGTGLAFSQSAGIILNRKFPHLIAGAMVGFERNGLSARGLDSLSLSESTSPLHPHGSVFFLWFNNKTEIFLEMALSGKYRQAFLSGITHRCNDFLNATLLFRSYSPGYDGLNPSAYATGSALQNETGPGILLNLYPFRNSAITYTLDYACFPRRKYRMNVPSVSFHSKTEVRYQAEPVTLLITASSKKWEANPVSNDPGITPVRLLVRKRLGVRLSLQLTESVIWNSRIEISRYQNGPTRDEGMLMLHELSANLSGKTAFRFRVLMFGTSEWDNRIYLYEPGLLYDYNFMACYGRGSRFSGIFRFRVTESLQTAVKAGITAYNHVRETGSGNDLIPGNRKWDIGFQIIWKH